MEVNEIYLKAASSMAYMVIKEAQVLNIGEGFHEELSDWLMTIQPDTDPEVLAFIANEVEQELREWPEKAMDILLPKLAAYLGEGYEEEMFYHIVKTAIIRIKEDDSNESDTYGGQDE